MLISLSNQHLDHLQKSQNSRDIISCLRVFAGYRLRQAPILKRYRDLLLFFCAFPNNKKVLTLAASELKRIASTANTKDSICSFSRPISLWLAKKFPGKVYLDSSEASKDTVRDILQILLPPVEYEKATQGELSLPERIKKISGFHKPSDQLKWILQVIEDRRLPDQVKENLYQQLQIFIGWKRENELLGVSSLGTPINKIYFQKRLTVNPRCKKIVKLKLPKPTPLSVAEKINYSGIMKTSLAAQYRETDPVTYADENELEIFNLGRGLQVIVIGMKKERRLSLESYIGYMAFKNGIPVSYGGGWMWGQRCKIGVNIYPPFRRSESAWLFCQILRIYYQHFGARKFIVKPYQFGKGNAEGIKSGAFWFYYKLGFRPVNEIIKKEAAAEWKKIKANRSYRTGLKRLRHLATCNLEWVPGKKSKPGFDAGEISSAISNMINRDFSGLRSMAVRSLTRRMKICLSFDTLKTNPLYKQQIVENWALLAGLIRDLAQWDWKSKKNLCRLIHLKQSGNERGYIILLQKHTLLWKSLQQAIV